MTTCASSGEEDAHHSIESKDETHSSMTMYLSQDDEKMDRSLGTSRVDQSSDQYNVLDRKYSQGDLGKTKQSYLSHSFPIQEHRMDYKHLPLMDIPFKNPEPNTVRSNIFEEERKHKNGTAFEEFWGQHTGILEELKCAIDTNFSGIVVSLNDIREAVERVIFKAKVREQGSSLIGHFLRAAQEDNFRSLSEVFDIFVSEADRFSRVIVSELFVEESQRLIPKVSIGGIAGGSKHIAG
jgi:hypothetical protein